MQIYRIFSESSVDKGRRVIFLSEYRRLISYMYAYDNGIKNKNVGFAKTECRGGNIKLWINLKGAYSQVENYRVYFFVRHDAAVVGIYMGDIAIKSGLGQFFTERPLSYIEKPFSDICGLYIDGGKGERMFASQWDDLPFDMYKVVEMKEYLSQLDAAKPDSVDMTVDKQDAQEAQRIPAEIVETKAVKMQDKNIEAGILKADKSDDYADDSKKNAAATDEAPVWEKPIRMVYIADNDADEDKADSADEGKETVKDATMLHVLEEEPAKTHSKMDMLFDGKEPVLAFSEDDIYDCVDIGLDELPKINLADSGLINNSFVNHGYFNFHHLLLGKKDGNILVVGVPGVYNRREKVTANMFGFEKFKFSMRSDVCINHFGYWYKEYIYQ